jgi:cell division protein ZapD
MITYEYPLVERIRTMLRLEDLFERVAFFLSRLESPEHHAALVTLFEVVDVTGRADLKSDLLQELERQKQVMFSFRNNPEIDQQVLGGVVRDIEQAHAGLYNLVGKIGHHLRENEWLMSIKQRTGIPGGACEFDLPSYHHWLNRDAEARLADLKAWLAPLLPIRDGAALVLKLLRESGKPARLTAQQGTFQQMLGGRTAQMVRIRLPRAADCVPEISANRYALNVRFVTAGAELRPRTVERDIDFELTFCNL